MTNTSTSAQAPAIKYALCVKAAEFLANPTKANLLTLQTYLVDRAIADGKNPVDDVNLQLISYLTMVDQHRKIFVYQRGKKGQEPTLHDLWSIGVGGHFDDALVPGETLREAIIGVFLREGGEEVGFEPDQQRIEIALDGDDCVLLHEALDPTNRVHLGINMLYDTSEADKAKFKLEEGVLINGRWETPHALLDYKLEPWSRMVLDRLLEAWFPAEKS